MKRAFTAVLSVCLFPGMSCLSQFPDSFYGCQGPQVPEDTLRTCGADVIIGNEWLPDNTSGGWPAEILFDPAGNCFYLHAGMHLIIIDATTFSRKRIRISESGSPSVTGGLEFTDEIAECKLVRNPLLNDIYCATEEERLLVIDGNTRSVEAVFDIPGEFRNLIIDLCYNQISQRLYWMMTDDEGLTVISVYDGTNHTFVAREYYSNTKGYKLLSAPDGSCLYLSCEEFGTGSPEMLVLKGDDLNVISHIPLDRIGIHMIYNTNTDRIYVVPEEGQELMVLAGDTVNSYLYSVPMNNAAIHITYNPLNNRIYCNGFGELQIIDGNSDVFIKAISLNGPVSRSLLFHEAGNMLYCGGDLNRIYKINGNTDEIVSQTLMNHNGRSRNLALDDTGVPPKLASANANTGHVTFFATDNMQLLELVQTAGYISAGCYNPNNNEIWLMQSHSINNRSFLNVYDGATGHKIGASLIPNSVNTLSQCAHNEMHNRIFATSTMSGRIIVIDGPTHSITGEIIVDQYPNEVYSIPGSDLLVCGTHNSILLINTGTLQIVATVTTEPCRKDAFVIGNDPPHKLYGTLSALGKVISVDYEDINSVKVDYVDVGDKPFLMACRSHGENKIYCARQSDIRIIDEETFTVEETIDIGSQIVSLEYNAFLDQLFVLSSAAQGLTYVPGKLSVITCNNNTFLLQEEFNAFFGSMVFNPLNNRLYFNTIWNFGAYNDEVALYSYDCDSNKVNAVLSPGLFRSHNECITWSTYSDILLNTKNNRVVVPNHGYSSATFVQCPTDRLSLAWGETWVSFPRMKRYGNNAFSSDSVLKMISAFPDIGIELRDAAGHYRRWENMLWSGNLLHVTSTSGYKLHLGSSEGAPPTIALHGARLRPSTLLTLLPDTENWVGYFIPFEMDPITAFGGWAWMNDHIRMVRTRHWTMVREEQQGRGGYVWRTTGHLRPFEYGDMIIIKTVGDAPLAFSWTGGDFAGGSVESVALSDASAGTTTGDSPETAPAVIPNPFAGSVAVSFPQNGFQEESSPLLYIFNITGGLVRIIKGECKDERFVFIWDGANQDGAGLPAGVYVFHVPCRSGCRYSGKILKF
ncbi:MAG: hypothetical protein JW861_03800 [Bacteroidales bacterium]|nr:hypothetical protein [Bacteroidales bacterium]